ncbi:DUF1684 domain-containing protein [Streptosporangium sp. NPDC050855]|uniref:DUF1684 domain-containing protein n=1 Tax=Streptosporangium sp. NPDC050855 TaxID=3366194 RepID=UPI003795AB7A
MLDQLVDVHRGVFHDQPALTRQVIARSTPFGAHDTFLTGTPRTHELACVETFVPGVLMLIVVDATSGTQTPAQGRSYLISQPAPGRLKLDLNRLMLLPHAFSSAVPCPTAPSGNRVPYAIHAGEKRVVFTR